MVHRLLGTVLLAMGLALAAVAPAAGSPAGGAVTVEHVAQAPRAAWNLISGQGIYNSSGSRCTLGFNATSGTARYVLSAGHCVSLGGSWYGEGGYIGPSGSASFPSNDYGVIRVQSADAISTALVDRYTSGSDVTITGVTRPTVGMSVCYSSPLSGWRCGHITAINQTMCRPDGCIYQLASSTMCPEPGASGAPVVTNPGSGTTVRAVGMVAGGSGDCRTGGTTWIQLISEPLSAYGLTLVTG